MSIDTNVKGLILFQASALNGRATTAVSSELGQL